MLRPPPQSSAPQEVGNNERIETLLQDIKFVNNLLSQCGLDSPFPFSRIVGDLPNASPSDLFNLEGSVKILITLLNSKQRENAFRNELEERGKRLSEDLDSKESLINKFHSKLEASEKELRNVQQQLLDTQNRLNQLEGIATTATEESNRLKSAFISKERHFNNELRKREREFEKLRDQLQTSLREPAPTLAQMTRIENVINENPSPSQSNDHQMELENIDRFELLENENANLRQLLISVNQILIELRKSCHEEEFDEMDSGEKLETLPIVWIYDQVKDEVEESLSIISNFIQAQLN